MSMNLSYLEECLPLIERKSDVADVISKIKQNDASIHYTTGSSMTEISLNHDEEEQADFKFTHIVSTNPCLNLSVFKNENEAIEQLWNDRKYYYLHK